MTPEKLPLHQTAAEAVARLREMATSLAVAVINPNHMTMRGWKPKRPIDQAKQEQQLETTCICLQVLTVNGNYYWERERALEAAHALRDAVASKA